MACITAASFAYITNSFTAPPVQIRTEPGHTPATAFCAKNNRRKQETKKQRGGRKKVTGKGRSKNKWSKNRG